MSWRSVPWLLKRVGLNRLSQLQPAPPKAIQTSLREWAYVRELPNSGLGTCCLGCTITTGIGCTPAWTTSCDQSFHRTGRGLSVIPLTSRGTEAEYWTGP
jgi:hypothetical protein